MGKLTDVKAVVFMVTGAIGGTISMALGGFDKMLQALLIFMLVDYITGLMVAFVFKNSPKTNSGAGSSKAGFKGLAKKAVILMLVMCMVQADKVLGISILRNAAVVGFIVNELVSIVENAGLCGLTLPETFNKALDLLQNKSKSDNQSNNESD